MKWWQAGLEYNSDTMTNEGLIVEIDMITRWEVSVDENFLPRLRACVKELRKRIQEVEVE